MNPNSISQSFVGLSLDSDSDLSSSSAQSSFRQSADQALFPTAHRVGQPGFQFLAGSKHPLERNADNSKRPCREKNYDTANCSDSDGQSKPPPLCQGAKAHLRRLNEQLQSACIDEKQALDYYQAQINLTQQEYENIELAWRATEPGLTPLAATLADRHPQLIEFRNTGTHQFNSHREIWAQRLLCDLIETPNTFNPAQPLNPRVLSSVDLNTIRMTIRNIQPSLSPEQIDRLIIRLALQMGASLDASGTFLSREGQGVYHLEPLFQSQMMNRPDLIKALVLEGANIHQRSSNPNLQNQTIWEHACRNNAPEGYLAKLKELGA
jgi:hypothetical protein